MHEDSYNGFDRIYNFDYDTGFSFEFQGCSNDQGSYFYEFQGYSYDRTARGDGWMAGRSDV